MATPQTGKPTQAQRPAGQPRELDETTQSDYALSQEADDAGDGRYSVAEEQNFDQQSDAARSIGQVEPDIAAAQQQAQGGTSGQEQNAGKKALEQGIERAVPRADE